MRGIYRYIQSGLLSLYWGYRGGRFRLTLAGIFGRNHCFRYSFFGCGWLVRVNFMKPPLAMFMHKHYSVKYGLDIPRTTKIGYGLYIGHGLGAVINPLTIIGNNCNISQFLSIGSNHGTPAIIGDNVYIGPHVSIVENVKIGNNVTIGAGSVVTKDIPANNDRSRCSCKSNIR